MAISGSMDQLSWLFIDLQNVITNLPMTMPEGTEDGPLAMHLCDFKVDEEEGPFYSFNRSWEQFPGIEANNGLTLIQAWVEALSSLIYKVCPIRVSTLQKTAIIAASSVQTQLAKGPVQNKDYETLTRRH
ncbi:uncharacterized protein BJ212DRAFT_1305098 [Suillus subaureus]|uniref:Uncharacterized protein n=1 Tax=Suillus subaureus TaxID=48587 RepID=A0A9P7J3Q4_9AGAM|nr:uncharacterized protein BJ212DRAFT_1305098 [Suillus subaureus]KAG1801224.1 hypothetical protein BJ212DRAFT_1305098 [Suillus subaureus]